MFRDHLLDYFATPDSAISNTINVELAEGFDPKELTKMPQHPLSILQSLMLCMIVGLVLSGLLYLLYLRDKKKKNMPSDGMAADPLTDPQANIAQFGSLYLAVFLDSAGALMLIPFLGPLAVHLGCGAVQITIISATFAGFQTVGTVILGVFADKYEKKKVLWSTLGACSVSLFACGLAVNLPSGKDGPINYAFWGLLLARAFAGFFASTVSLVETMISERCTTETRTQTTGVVMGMFGVGALAGPLAGSLMYDWGFVNLCFLAGTVTLVNVSYVIFSYEPPAYFDQAAGKEEMVLKDAVGELRDDAIKIWLLIGTFLATGAPAMVFSVIGIYNMQVFKWGGGQLGILTAVSTLVSFVAVANMYRLVLKLGNIRSIILGNLIRFVALTLYTIRLPFIPWVTYPFLFATMPMIDAQMQNEMVTGAPKHVIGTFIGILQALRSLGESVCPPIAGFLLDMDVYYPWFGAGFASLFCAAIFYRFWVASDKKLRGL